MEAQEQSDTSCPPAETKDLLWLDAFDPHMTLRGLAWPGENQKHKNFHRIPESASHSIPESVKLISQCPASVFLSFFTDSSDISIRMKLVDLGQMDHMPATGVSGAELYLREGSVWHAISVARPGLTELEFERILVEGATPHLREFRLYLPLYKKLESVALGFALGSVVTPAIARERIDRIVFYGTSITQGGCASTAGSDFVSTLGRLLDAETINLGFSGVGKGEPAMAHLIREIDADMFVLDFLANALADTLACVLPEFISLLRKAHPTTPIVVLSSPAFNQSLLNPKLRIDLQTKRDIAMRAYLQCKDAGDENIHFIDGAALLPAGESGAFVDGVHPTSFGFATMAARLAPQLRAIVLTSSRSA